MSAGFPIGPEHFRAHAARLDVLRARLGLVGDTVQRFEQDQAAFGRLCGWILTGLGDRHVRHGELVDYIEETLQIFVREFHRVADGEQRLADLVGPPDDPPAAASHTPAYSADDPDGPRPATSIIEDVLETVERREWVEPQLAEAAPVAEFAIPVAAEFAELRATALDHALDRIVPLRQMLDDLTGMPDVVAKQADHWSTMATDLEEIGTDLRRCLDEDFGGSDREDVRDYLTMMANNVEGLIGLAAISTAMTVVTKAAGDLILLTRDIVRGVIGDLLTRVIVWSADTTVVPLPVLVSRLGAVVATAWRVDAYLAALVNSISNLSQTIDG